MKGIVIIFFVLLSIACFANIADARKIFRSSARNYQKRVSQDLGCKCRGRAALKCGLCKSDEAVQCRKNYIKSCSLRCSLAKKCSEQIEEKCSFFEKGTYHYDKCSRTTAAKHCLNNVETKTFKGCKCNSFAISLCGAAKDGDSKECRKHALSNCKEQCGSHKKSKKRICVTGPNCNCKSIAAKACEFSNDKVECHNLQVTACKKRCAKTRQCFPLCCRNAGHKRCKLIVAEKCKNHSGEAHEACVLVKTRNCHAHALGTCFRARREYKYRVQCDLLVKDKCAKLDEPQRCNCIKSVRKACIQQKVNQRVKFIRRTKCCQARSVLLCNDKKTCKEVKQCRQNELSLCAKKHNRRIHVTPSECISQAVKYCGKSTGKCFEHKIFQCTNTNCNNFCEYQNWKKCEGDYDCLKSEHAKCKVPKCWNNRSICKDNNACTIDVCDVKVGCVHIKKTCNDNNLCTVDRCDTKLGCVHTQKRCDDGVACTVDTCNADTGKCVFTPDNTKCVATQDCHHAICTAKGCHTVKDAKCRKTLPPCVCEASTNPCEKVTCVLGDDLKPQCSSVIKSCSDGNTCTADYCDFETGACVHKRKDTPECHDTQVCTHDVDCLKYAAQSGITIQKDCKSVYCDTTTGKCAYNTVEGCIPPTICSQKCKPAPCQQSAVCKYDTAGNVQCVTENVCDDNNECTVDTCSENGCQHKFVASDKCIVECKDQVCCTLYAHTAGYAKDCKDLVYVPEASTCKVVPSADQTSCAHLCTDDSCCQAWALNQKLYLQCQTAGYDKTQGKCIVKDVDNKSKCECNLKCAPANPCQTAVCVNSDAGYTCQVASVACNNGDACSVGTCNPASGKCEYKFGNCKCKDNTCCNKWAQTNANTQCFDAVYEAAVDACVLVQKKDKTGNLVCPPPQPKTCTLDCKPRNPCESASCVTSANGYVCQYTANKCDDGITCTADSCNTETGACVHNFIPGCVCKDLLCCKAFAAASLTNQNCKTAIYNPTTKACQIVSVDGTIDNKCTPPPPPCQQTCKPSNACETAQCVTATDGSTSCVRTAVSCDDGVKCTADSCDKVSGKCSHTFITNCLCTDTTCCQAQYISQNLAQKCKQTIYNTETKTCDIVPLNTPNCVPKLPPPPCVCPANGPCDHAVCLNGVCSHFAKTCDDGVKCTADSCDAETGKCSHTFITGCQCTDETCCEALTQSQNLLQKCQKLVWSDTAKSCLPVPITDSKQCSCHKTCKPNGPCDVARCVSTDAGFACQHTSTKCDDGIACTVDSCDANGACSHKFIAGCKECNNDACCVASANAQQLYTNCKTSKYNSVTKTCDVVTLPPKGKTCVPPTCELLDCKSLGPCDVAQCVIGDNGAVCQHTTVVSAACSVPTCTCQPRNKCETVSGCTIAADGTAQCSYSPITCDDGKGCTVDSCNPSTGACVNTYVPNTTTCPGPCTQDGDCLNVAKTLNLSPKCLKAVCNIAQQSCQIVPDTACSTCQATCKATDACHTATCVQGTKGYVCTQAAKSCDDGKGCTVDSCNPTTGACVNTYVANSTLCPASCGCATDSDCGKSCSLTANLDTCHQAVCDKTLGACKVQVKAGCTCGQNSDCPAGTFGAICTNQTCVSNTCAFASDCKSTVAGEVCYCSRTAKGNKACVCKPGCTKRSDCNDNNPCTVDSCLKPYGYCQNVQKCDDQNACTIDIGTPSADLTTCTCTHKVRSCSNNATLYSKDFDTLTPAEKAKWIGQCDKSKGCVGGCVANDQCFNNQGCVTSTCTNGQCVNAQIDNPWCDPVIDTQPIWYQGDPAVIPALEYAGYDIKKLISNN